MRGGTYGESGATFIVIDAVIDGERPPGSRRVWFDPEYLPGGLLMRHLPPDGLWRLDMQLPIGTDIEAATTDENVDRLVHTYLDDIGHEANVVRRIWTSTYRPRALCLEDFRDGRILYAGDAAHLMPFFGGFGMNAGIDDADNLRWKLGLVIRGEAPEELLDTYSAERIPAILHSLEIQLRSAEFMTPTSEASEQLRLATLTLAAQGNALAAGMGRHRLSRPIAYAGSPICLPDRDTFTAGPAPGEPTERGWVDVDGARTYLHDLLDGRFCLLAFAAGATDATDLLDDLGQTPRESAAAIRTVLICATPGPDTASSVVHAVDVDGLAVVYGADAGAVYLIRPDGVVAARWHRPARAALADAVRTAIAARSRPTIGEAAV